VCHFFLCFCVANELFRPWPAFIGCLSINSIQILLNQIWIGFENIVLNFFATFGSVLGLQITVLKSLVQWSFSNPSRLHIVFVKMLSLVYEQ